MIAVCGDFPLIQYEGGHVVRFERDMLLRPLLRAAGRAGYPDWWLAEHVVKSVSAFLRFDFESTIITIRSLTEAVQSVLEVIGYSEVALHFLPDPPVIEVSLVDLAQEAGSGYELAFFEVLGRRLHVLLHLPNSRLALVGLRRCVKLLRSKKVWSRDCGFLRSEIVAYVREQVEAERPSHPVALSLS